MRVASASRPAPLLDPVERISEVLFGLIMVLTFTGSLSVAEAGRDEVRTMLIGALGCNLAWGIIDAVLYLMGRMAERGEGVKTLGAVLDTSDSERAHQLIAAALPPVVASVMRPDELEAIRQRLTSLPPPPGGARLNRADWLGALGVFLWVFVSTFPVILPFMFMTRVAPAMRVSNAIAVALLLLAGFAFGRVAGRNPWLTGAATLLLGIVLVGLTIMLGG